MELSVEQTLPPPSLLASEKEKTESKPKLTSQQWVSLILLAVGNFGLALCSGLQAPFFPREAEMKGATPSQYGLVFGLFYLTTFVFSPIFGKLMPVVGPDHLRDMGMFVVGVCFILFGFLDKSPPGWVFLTLAYVVRFVEGVGSAAYKTSNFPMMAAFFPNNMATAVGVLETMYGLGLIIGPTVGGFLYEISGYTMPFALSGSILIVIAFLSVCALPKIEVFESNRKKEDMWRFVLDPLVICYICLLTVSSTMIGFNLATLEPHLRQFHLSPLEVGLVFVLCGGFYGISSFLWGSLLDKQFNPTVMTCISCLFLALSFTLIGPAPFLPFDSHLWIVSVSLVFLGCGFGANRVIPFVDCLRNGLERGFESSMSTYGMVSGVFNGTIGIGFFLGPTIGGICMDYFGYEWSSSFLAFLTYIVFGCFVVHCICESRKKKKKDCEVTPLLENGFLPGVKSKQNCSSHSPKPPSESSN